MADLSLYTWGSNDHGTLCVPSFEDYNCPQRLLSLRSHFTRCVGAAAELSVCSTASGVVLQWGGPSGGLPCPLLGAPTDCCALVTDGRRVHALTDEGHVFSWEVVPAAAVQLGVSISRLRIPVDVTQLACGETHALALAEGGSVYSWGRGVEGQLGRDAERAAASGEADGGDGAAGERAAESDGVPRRMDALDELHVSIRAVACGAVHSALLSSSGKLLLCGLLHPATLVRRGRCIGNAVAEHAIHYPAVHAWDCMQWGGASAMRCLICASAA